MPMELLNLFIAASIPVIKFLLLTVVGSILAIDRVDILGEDARKHLNRVGFYVFTPALIATNLAKTATFASMITLWFMPLNILFTYIIGSVLGWMVIKMSRVPSQLRGLIIGCCSAGSYIYKSLGNLGSLPLVVLPTLCTEKGSPFGDPDVCHTHGMAYASLSMAVGAIYLWTYVYNIVRISTSKSNERLEVNVRTNNAIFPYYTEALLQSDECSISGHHVDHYSLPSNRCMENVSTLVMLQQLLKTIADRLSLKKIFAPSTIAAIVGFTIGGIPQVRRSMIGATAPLRVIQDSASLLGDGSVPVLTLIVGGNLIKGLKESGTRASVIVGVVIVRYVLLPLSGVVILKGAVHFGFVTKNPLYQFALLLQYAVPPALNIGTITQLFGSGESEYSVIMLWTYALASVSLTIWSTIFMWLVS